MLENQINIKGCNVSAIEVIQGMLTYAEKMGSYYEEVKAFFKTQRVQF